MSSRSASLVVAGLLSLGLFSGCPTRSTSEPSVDGAGGATVSAQDAAGADLTTKKITLPDDAGLGVVDAGSLDTTVDSDPGQGNPQPPPLSDVGVACTINAQCATGSCVDGVCCSSAACGGCQSCAVAGSLGACSSLPKLTEDPRSSCVGTMACDGDGHCAEVNGNACSSTSDCVSGFCVDGVCCESACDQQCYACNTTFELLGMCRPLGGGTDLSASVVCAGARSCVSGASPDQPLCLLNDGEACTSGGDCVSGQCSTFYADADGDKFGNANRSINVCGPADAPPPSYVTTAGDCCDSDGNAHPNQSAFFAHADACGSFDYNCDGDVQKEHATGPCAGYSGSPDCGMACIVEVLMSPVGTYTQACR
jgi:hypothetical protein